MFSTWKASVLTDIPESWSVSSSLNLNNTGLKYQLGLKLIQEKCFIYVWRSDEANLRVYNVIESSEDGTEY